MLKVMLMTPPHILWVADDTTLYFVGDTHILWVAHPYFEGSTATAVLEKLSDLTKKLFSNNQTKANNDKCHLNLSSPEEGATIQIENPTIKCSKLKRLSVKKLTKNSMLFHE